MSVSDILTIIVFIYLLTKIDMMEKKIKQNEKTHAVIDSDRSNISSYEKATKLVLENHNIRSADDVHSFGILNIYKEVEKKMGKHWNRAENPTASVRASYQKLVSGYTRSS